MRWIGDRFGRRLPQAGNFGGPKLLHAGHFTGKGYEPGNPYLHSFREQIRLGVMPIGGRAKKRNFSVDLHGEDAEKAIKLLSSLSRNQYEKNVPRVVFGAFDAVIGGLLEDGSAIFEVVSVEDRLALLDIPVTGLLTVAGRVFQRVPQGVTRSGWYGFRSCSHAKVFSFKIPKELGGSYAYKNMISRFSKLNLNLPSFVVFESGRRNDTGFDYEEFSRLQYVASERLISDLGWGGLGLSETYTTEYFRVDVSVSQHLVQAVLRARLESDFNANFKRVGLDAVLKISGLPTPDEIRSVSAALREGRMSFEEALEKISL